MPPEAFISPVTSNLDPGIAVPIPTLVPLSKIRESVRESESDHLVT